MIHLVDMIARYTRLGKHVGAHAALAVRKHASREAWLVELGMDSGALLMPTALRGRAQIPRLDAVRSAFSDKPNLPAREIHTMRVSHFILPVVCRICCFIDS